MTSSLTAQARVLNQVTARNSSNVAVAESFDPVDKEIDTCDA
jgi:hypothetical protein